MKAISRIKIVDGEAEFYFVDTGDEPFVVREFVDGSQTRIELQAIEDLILRWRCFGKEG